MAEMYGMKAEIKGFIITAQNQETRNYQANIKNGSNPICRLCKQKTESIDHLVSSCSILTPIEYK